MAVDWYLKIADKEVGPLSPGQLKAMADRGQLAPEDPVRRGAAGRWVPAARVRGLFGSSSTPPTPDQRPASPVQDQVPVRTETSAIYPLEFCSPDPAAGAEPGVASSGEVPRLPPQTNYPIEAPGQPPAGPASPPVAEPIDPATVAGQEIPVATPVFGGAPGPGSADQANPFAFLADRPSGPEVAGAASSVYAAARRRRRQNVIFAIVAVALVTGGAAGGLWWLASMRTAGAPTDSRSLVPSAVQPEKKKRRRVDIPEVDELLGIAGEQEPGSPAAAGAAPAETPPSLWKNASEEVALEGDVAVQVTAAEIGRPRLTRGGGVPLQTPEGEEYLTLRLRLSNRSGDREVSYTSWAAVPAGVELVDDRGRAYPMKQFHTAKVVGQQEQTTIAPSASMDEVLLFEKPTEGARYLRLKLPAVAYGGPGTARLQIPMSLVRRGGESRGAGATRAAAGGGARRNEEPASRPGGARLGAAGGEEEEPRFGPIPIPGLESPEEGPADEEPVSGFDENPDLMEAPEELRRRQAEQRQTRDGAGVTASRRRGP